jgi:hypothetical protein
VDEMDASVFISDEQNVRMPKSVAELNFVVRGNVGGI